ncbi:mRNA-decapping enzyme subunit 2 [Extremus antarcticus]|uniref:mRNA-decapping enzyme subunit 2 n=1 Tax=Extremus antarcticus TaxID=702011 RepID=A0AAJ0GJL8_9PEZI|nr:mRNA-decapping enzyme subunit 2 [Extremus antarcticus]
MTTSKQPTTLVDWLDDLTVRFLLNLPASELSSVPRLCFQVEEAQWFYEDFVRPAVAASGHTPLPSLALRQFCLLLFQHCPLLSGFTDAQHIAAYEEFLAYKVRVPVRGAIMLDEEMENVVLVRGWKKGASWSFPRGKINKDEKDLDCAVREVYEETGYDAREAGLVPENEDDAKFIDITMREQHMRLFVLRGVANDTHFEPRTRKEIGAIKWYAIKDLPGFKKQKIHHDGEGASASKFYMVAPFLAQLKKWIGQQQKQGTTRKTKGVPINGRAVQAVAEDDGEVEDESGPEMAALYDDKIADLKKMLRQPASTDSAATQAGYTAASAPANDLLAMLRGTAPAPSSNQIPQTPLEQVNLFPREPETPQPDHLRYPSLAHQQRQPPPPQFPLPPQQLFQQEQRHGSLPTPNIFGPSPNESSQGHSLGGMPPHPQQHYFQQQQNMPHPPPPGMPFRPPHSGFPQDMRHHPDAQRQPMPPHMHPQHMQIPPQQHQPNAYLAQGQGAIASGPAVPNASQLPPPRLNAQSMKLLDAFKSNGNIPTAPARASASTIQRPASSHQTALLGLLEKAPVTQAPDALPHVSQQQPQESVSPTLSNTTERTIRPMKRKPTLNEITRTLPMKLKAKSPPIISPRSPPAESPATPQPERERPKSRQLFDPSALPKAQSAIPTPEQRWLSPSTLQPTAAKSASRSPKANNASPAGSPSRRNGTHSTSTGQQAAPPFTILARPGSARGPKSLVAPTSPLRNERPQADFHPQVLKRSNGDGHSETAQPPADKKDQLLTLFGKPPTSTTPTSPAQATPATTIIRPQQTSNTRNTNLLDLFNPPPTLSQQPTPPHAPRIEPERRPSARPTPHLSTAPPPKQQNLLLDLFNKTSCTPVTSPGTPISPFTLGTPATSSGPTQLPGTLNGRSGGPTQLPAAMASGRSSRLASVSSPGGSGSGTPTEAKEFLMGFLNGVVRDEGHWGAGGGRR